MATTEAATAAKEATAAVEAAAALTPTPFMAKTNCLISAVTTARKLLAIVAYFLKFLHLSPCRLALFVRLNFFSGLRCVDDGYELENLHYRHIPHYIIELLGSVIGYQEGQLICPVIIVARNQFFFSSD
jgi:hypothetical protein